MKTLDNQKDLSKQFIFRMSVIFLLVSFFFFQYGQSLFAVYAYYPGYAPVWIRLLNSFIKNVNIVIYLSLAFPAVLATLKFIEPTLKSMSEPENDDIRNKALKRILWLPYFIVTVNVIGFTIGPAIGCITNGMFDVLPYFLMVSISSALFSSSIMIILINDIMMPVKKKIGIVRIKHEVHEMSIFQRILLTSLSGIMLSFSIFALIIFYYLNTPPESIDTGPIVPHMIFHLIDISLFTSFQIYLIFLVFNRMIDHVRNLIVGLKEQKETLYQRIPIASYDEIGIFVSDFNDFMAYLSDDMMKRINRSSVEILESVNSLSVSSNQIASTSSEQAAAVKQIVSTMESTESISKDVLDKVREVNQVSSNTQHSVEKGREIIQNNLSKMEQIRQSTDKTISSIHNLGEQLSSVWDIVKIINNIADQTKIIAFNAELEASSVGDSGKNFEIVAAEIRRLADNTMESTREIKARINDIQRYSDSLVLASEEEQQKVSEGWNLTQQAGELFKEILQSSEITSESANYFSDSISQQVESFEQILVGLKQISDGIDNFADSTSSTRSSTQKLKKLSEDLDSLVRQYLQNVSKS